MWRLSSIHHTYVTKAPVATLNTEAQITSLFGNTHCILSHIIARRVIHSKDNGSFAFGILPDSALCIFFWLSLTCILSP
jgi:hypothetical protein